MKNLCKQKGDGHGRATKDIDALKFLMKAHHLTQSDLSEIGSQGVISEILRGKRPLNLRQSTAIINTSLSLCLKLWF